MSKNKEIRNIVKSLIKKGTPKYLIKQSLDENYKESEYKAILIDFPEPLLKSKFKYLNFFLVFLMSLQIIFTGLFTLTSYLEPTSFLGTAYEFITFEGFLAVFGATLLLYVPLIIGVIAGKRRAYVTLVVFKGLIAYRYYEVLFSSPISSIYFVLVVILALFLSNRINRMLTEQELNEMRNS